MNVAAGGLRTVTDSANAGYADNESAAALSLAANVSDGLTAETVVLMTPEEFDAATSKQVSFRPPGSSCARAIRVKRRGVQTVRSRA